MAGFIRARQDLFPALREFNKEASLEIVLFKCFLEELEEMRLDCRVLGTLTPLMADHMSREECYYLLKLHEVDPESVKVTSCDPTKPRVET
jgi:AMMECR1 domain-containing protein